MWRFHHRRLSRLSLGSGRGEARRSRFVVSGSLSDTG